MRPGTPTRRSPITVPAVRGRRPSRRAPGIGPLGAEALEAPVPGTLLVLLSRLHRAEEGVSGGGASGRRAGR